LAHPNQQCQNIWGVGVNGKTEEGMKPPNPLFVFPDQMRGQAMGFLGEEPVRKPNLDRFASEGLVLY
jgi:arylsulfatase A-like enzyme